MVHTHVQRYCTPSITGGKWRPQGLLPPTRLVNRKQESCTVTSVGEERTSRHFYMLLGLWKKISQDLKRLCPQPSQPFHSWVHTPERCLLAYVHQETNSRRFKAAFFSNSPKPKTSQKSTTNRFLQWNNSTAVRTTATSSICMNLTNRAVNEKSVYIKSTDL